PLWPRILIFKETADLPWDKYDGYYGCDLRRASDELMMKLALANRRFSFSALLALGALLYLCFSLNAHSNASSKASIKNCLSGSHKPETESGSSPPRGSAKSILAKAQVSIRRTVRATHSPPHPATLPPQPFTWPSLGQKCFPP